MSGFDFRARTDGACRGNPGPAAIGVSIENADGDEVALASEVIGETTNNVAEYRALIKALEMCLSKRDENPPRKHGNIPL